MVHPESTPPATPHPITPESLLWKYAGDYRIGLTGLSAGILQLLHPAIGAGVKEHSKFFEEPWDRIFRSIPQIIGVVYDDDPETTGRRVRDYHKSVKGVDHKGRSYHALNPDTYWWAHATFHHMVEEMIDRFDTQRLNRSMREELYEETTVWYRRYGVSMRPVPPSYREFREKWEYVCSEVLEMNPAAERAIGMAVERKVDKLPGVPDAVWKLGQLPVSEFVRIVAIGGLPKNVRKRFDIPWSPLLDGTRLRLFEEMVKNRQHLPRPVLFSHFPAARAAYARYK